MFRYSVLNSLKRELPQSPVLGQLCIKQSHQARARGAVSAQTPREHFHTSASCDSHSQQLQNTLGTPQTTNAAAHSFPHRAARNGSVLTGHSGHELAQFSQVHYRKLLQLLPIRKCWLQIKATEVLCISARAVSHIQVHTSLL